METDNSFEDCVCDLPKIDLEQFSFMTDLGITDL